MAVQMREVPVNVPEHVARQRRVALTLFATSAVLAALGAVGAGWLLLLMNLH